MFEFFRAWMFETVDIAALRNDARCDAADRAALSCYRCDDGQLWPDHAADIASQTKGLHQCDAHRGRPVRSSFTMVAKDGGPIKVWQRTDQHLREVQSALEGPELRDT